jgi:hypothetical protein
VNSRHALGLFVLRAARGSRYKTVNSNFKIADYSARLPNRLVLPSPSHLRPFGRLGAITPAPSFFARGMRIQKRSKGMSSGWQPIVTAPKNDERILVSGGTWIRGNKQTLPQSFPCLVIWDEAEWLICDNEGPRALIRGPKFWMAIPPTLC